MSRSRIAECQACDDEFFSHLRFVEKDDAEFIFNLRSNKNLNTHLSQSVSSVEYQRKWIESYKEREEKGEEYYFVIKHQNRRFGVVRMYDFQPQSFCWGSWIILPNRPSGLVTFSALSIYEIGFEVLDFEQSHFDVKHDNRKVIDFHLRSGARKTSEDNENSYFVFEKKNWKNFKDKSKLHYMQHRVFVG